MPLFVARTIIPKAPLSAAKVRGHVLSSLQKIGKDIHKDLSRIVATWDHSVTFSSPTIRYARGDVFVLIYTDDEIFGYLNRGTQERWAVMNDPYRPKTRKGNFNSTGGVRTYYKGYYTAIRGKRAMQQRGMGPQPGIEAREWTKLTLLKHSLSVRSRLKGAIRKGLAR